MTARAGHLARALLVAWPFLAAAADAPLPPPDSLYQLQVTLSDQSGAPIGLDRYRGQPVLVSMFYASCGSVCPTLLGTVKSLENGLEPAARNRLRVLLISLDPERDTPAALSALAAKQRADLGRWTLARPDPADVRKLAALLGVQYRQLPDGDFSHSTVLSLLDADGRLLARSSSVGRPDPALVTSLRRVTAAPPD